MTTENFCYWLQGYLEVQNPGVISEEKIQIIKDHLSLVFLKVTPNIDRGSIFTRPPPYDWHCQPQTINPNISFPNLSVEYGPQGSC